MSASEKSLELRLAVLEADREIQQLKATYAGLCDRGYPGEDISQLFTEDAVWDGGVNFGLHVGRDAIRDYFNVVSGQIIWAVHYMVGPSIHIADDGEHATGSWYLWQPCTQVLDGETIATWISGKYADSYERVNGTWLFSRVSITFDTIVDVRESWIDHPFVGRGGNNSAPKV